QGPSKYEGPPMKEIHRLMGIKDAEFDALGDHLKKALIKNEVGAKDMESMLSAMELKRNDIVTVKEPAPAPAPAKPKPAGAKNTGAPSEPAANKPRSSTDPAAKAIIDKAIKALGGEEKLTKALQGSTWKMKGKLTFGGNDNPISTESTLKGL